MSETASPGGLNPDNGFPPIFVDVSEKLGRYNEYDTASSAIAEMFAGQDYLHVLDICCGPGHFANSLAKQGFKVTGIDLSELQIIEARMQYPEIDFKVGDMANLPSRQFDLLTNVYTSFGYLDTREQDMALLKHWHSRLRPNGCLIMELADMDRARNRIPENGTLTRNSGNVREELCFDWEKNLLEVEYIQPDGQSWLCYTRIYEKKELVEELKNAGFGSVEFFGDFEKKSKEDDDNLVIYAQKS